MRARYRELPAAANFCLSIGMPFPHESHDDQELLFRCLQINKGLSWGSTFSFMAETVKTYRPGRVENFGADYVVCTFPSSVPKAAPASIEKICKTR